MNRENKRKTFEKGYYKNHPCNDSFTCKVCGRLVTPDAAGTDHRNHCPNCLSSLHVDIEPGDREADCGGIMEPIAVWVRGKGEWAIIHRCRRCGALSSNRVAADDNPMKLMSIALKPLCEPPFPLERIEEMTALLGGADVIVADGYSGNILLKTVEGAAKLLLGEMKKAFLSSTKSKLGALLVKDSLGDVKKLLDPSEVGGTPFLGISKPVLKAHGSSDARAIRNAVFRAVEYAQSGIIADVEAHIDVMKVEKNG